MRAIEFPQANTRIAEDQPQYQTLPAYVGQVGATPEEVGMICCMELSDDEWQKVLVSRKIWVRTLTFGQPLQPFLLQTDRNIFEQEDNPVTDYSKEMFHENIQYKEVEIKPSFWERVQMLFGYKLCAMVKVTTWGFQHSVDVKEHGSFIISAKDLAESKKMNQISIK